MDCGSCDVGWAYEGEKETPGPGQILGTSREFDLWATGHNDHAVASLVAADPNRRLLLDVGRPEAHEAPTSAADFRIDPIVSTETLGSLDQLRSTPQKAVTAGRILSLDLDGSGLVARSSVIAAMPATSRNDRESGAGGGVGLRLLILDGLLLGMLGPYYYLSDFRFKLPKTSC